MKRDETNSQDGVMSSEETELAMENGERKVDSGDSAPTSDVPTSDISILEAKIAELTDQLQRAVAEQQNMKKRFERDREDIVTFAATTVLLALLPPLDELDRAAQHLPAELAENDWAKGVVTIRANLEKTFNAIGVERVGAVGDKYDPALHEALGTGDGAPDTIITVFESGYRYRGRTLRPAKVIVGATAPASPPEST